MSGQQEFCAALLDPLRPCPAGLTTWNGSDPAARFAVYRNNVAVSLVDALAETHAVTQELVGKEFFRAMALQFVRSQPPRSRVLTFYGQSFPAFIEAFPPAAGVPYLGDVARLEWLRVRAYHAEDAGGLDAEAIARYLADPAVLPAQQIVLHPSVGLLRSRYAVVSLWAAHQGLAEISSVDPYVAECALVVRAALEVQVIRLDAGAGDFVACLQQGASLGVAAETAGSARSNFDLTGTLLLLLRRNAISSMRPASPED